MKRCSFCEWIPILPIPVWPLAWQCSWGQNTVVGSMTLLLAMRGNMTTRSMSGPRLLYNVTAPRLGGELSKQEATGKTRYRKVVAIKKFFVFLKENEIVKNNPAD